MTNRQIIIPDDMRLLYERAGYAPGVKVGRTLYCAGQVGRTPELSVIEDPEQQFLAAWNNLRLVLEAGGCKFEDVVEITTYHVDMHIHMPVFRRVKDEVFPRGTCAWTCIGVSELARPGLLVEIKCVAVER
ncbi:MULTISPECIES: RidA family protein [unclassified Pseudomonas]|uniref:RidA family protein n=1 Tax=unclassified Pseudomonas TaxID=196821 RepID=UPI000D33FFB7|nr:MULTISPECIES: RidA family protein [unclassified Pseudomonas]RAU47996.1 RidA family protein [Pseudomonas sp. RIT 409]RAU55310.1 RidA family protein [Pseudomonas sp. RIT 412]